MENSEFASNDREYDDKAITVLQFEATDKIAVGMGFKKLNFLFLSLEVTKKMSKTFGPCNIDNLEQLHFKNFVKEK